MPQLGVYPSKYCFGTEKLEWLLVWLYEMMKNFEDMITRFDTIHERDRQQERRTDRHRLTAWAALMHSIARQKPVIGRRTGRWQRDLDVVRDEQYAIDEND